MMKKIILPTLLLLCVIALILGTVAYLKQPTPPPQPSWEEKLKTANLQIDKVTLQIEQERLEAMNAQMDALRLMRVEWEAYLKKVKEVDKHEETIHDLENRLQVLISERNQLLEQNPSQTKNNP